MLNRLFATRSSVSRSFNYSVLTQAIAANDIRRATAVMYSSPELINDTDRFGNSALHVAVQLESEVLVKELIARGAIVDASNILGYSPLVWAAKIGWEAGVEIMTSAMRSVDRTHFTQYSPFNFALSERAYKNLRYKVVLLLSLGFLLYPTYWYAHFFIDAREMVEHGVPTRGEVTRIYSGTTTGLIKHSYRTATVTYLDGYKIYINGENLREGGQVNLTYSELHPHMAKPHSLNDSFLDYAAWRGDSYLHLTLYLTVIVLMWGTWVACLKSYRKGKPISGADLNEFFASGNLPLRILAIAGITRPSKEPTAKSQRAEKLAGAPVSSAEVRPVAAKTAVNNVADDVPDKLRQIEKLFKEGVITESEFNEKKREFLQRL